MKISANGIHINVEEKGFGNLSIVFLHYWGGSSRTWRHVIKGLASEFRTVAVDQRGWGRSDAPASGYALSDMADDAQAVIEALNLDRYILVGHSMGGKVSQLIASRHSRGLIGLALVAPAPPCALNLPLDVRQAMVRAYDSRDSIIATVEQVLAPNGLDREDLETVIADSLSGAPAAKVAWPLFTSQEDITSALDEINVPVIVVSGELDRVDPPDVLRRELLPRIPKAALYFCMMCRANPASYSRNGKQGGAIRRSASTSFQKGSRGEPDGEGGKNEVEGNREGELDSRQRQGRQRGSRLALARSMISSPRALITARSSHSPRAFNARLFARLRPSACVSP